MSCLLGFRAHLRLRVVEGLRAVVSLVWFFGLGLRPFGASGLQA